jgi:hypothetical protein
MKNEEEISQGLASSMLADTFKALDEGKAPSPADSDPDDQATKQLVQQMKSLSTGQRGAFAQQVQMGIHGQFVEIESRLSGPEAQWLQPESVEAPIPHQPSMSALAESVAQMVGPFTSGQEILAAMKVRAQVRILKLHTLVLEYRWKHNRLPVNLREANVEVAALEDPLSGKQFVYEPHADRNIYRLFSPGNKDTGVVELKYRHTAGTGGQDGNAEP